MGAWPVVWNLVLMVQTSLDGGDMGGATDAITRHHAEPAAQLRDRVTAVTG